MVKWNGPFRSGQPSREKWSTLKAGPIFSKLFRSDRTDPFSFRSKFPEFWLNGSRSCLGCEQAHVGTVEVKERGVAASTKSSVEADFLASLHQTPSCRSTSMQFAARAGDSKVSVLAGYSCFKLSGGSKN